MMTLDWLGPLLFWTTLFFALTFCPIGSFLKQSRSATHVPPGFALLSSPPDANISFVPGQVQIISSGKSKPPFRVCRLLALLSSGRILKDAQWGSKVVNDLLQPLSGRCLPRSFSRRCEDLPRCRYRLSRRTLLESPHRISWDFQLFADSRRPFLLPHQDKSPPFHLL